MHNFSFNNKTISTSNKPYIIAEVGQAHDGSLGAAHAYIDAAKSAGADAVKFQTHIASEESTREDEWRVKFSYQDDSRYDYWKRMEFTQQQWSGLKEHCDKIGIDFISTPFSAKAVDLLEDLNVPFWKIASGEINNHPLLEQIAKTKKPIIVSSGMSSINELQSAVSLIREHGCPVAIMQCTSAYPCPADQVGLNNIALFKQLFDCPVGLSDHSGDIFAGLAAVSLGASILEVHIVFNKSMFGPDTSSSLTPDNLKRLVEGSEQIFTMTSNPVDKDKFADVEMKSLRKLFNKSIVIRHDLKAGEQLKAEDLVFKKPGKGISPEKIDEVIGKVLKHNVVADHILMDDDLVG